MVTAAEMERNARETEGGRWRPCNVDDIYASDEDKDEIKEEDAKAEPIIKYLANIFPYAAAGRVASHIDVTREQSGFAVDVIIAEDLLRLAKMELADDYDDLG